MSAACSVVSWHAEWLCVCVSVLKVSRQLFKPLLSQLIHWFTSSHMHSHPVTAVLLDTIMVLLGLPLSPMNVYIYIGRLINTSYNTLYAVFRVNLMKVTLTTTVKVINHEMVVVVNYKFALVVFYVLSLFTLFLSTSYDFSPSLT